MKDFEEPEIYTYSIESTIAEKFDSILSLMETTGRMKDFYDIYYLSSIFNYNGTTLYEAIKKTTDYRNRATQSDAMERIKSFPDNPSMNKMWENYEPASTSELSFSQVVNRIDDFLGPIYAALLSKKNFYREMGF